MYEQTEKFSSAPTTALFSVKPAVHWCHRADSTDCGFLKRKILNFVKTCY